MVNVEQPTPIINEALAFLETFVPQRPIVRTNLPTKQLVGLCY